MYSLYDSDIFYYLKAALVMAYNTLDGQRCQTFVVNVDRNDQVPPLVEPLFQWMGASVDVIPVMNFDDLKRGLQNR